LTTVREMLDKGAHIEREDKDDCDRRAIHQAAWEGHGKVIELLHSRGAEIDPPDEFNETPLHHAAEQGHALACKTLLELYADPSRRDDDGDTPLDTARAKGHKGCVALLEAAMQ
jgi:ankyrin repeat protein